MTGLSILCLALVLGASALPAQEVDTSAAGQFQKYFTFDDPPPFECLFTLFPTILLQHEIELKDFVRSRTFTEIRAAFGDIKAVDAIFVRAMQLTDNNTGASLLISSLATFEHDMVGTKNPVFAFYLPLTGESDKDFKDRVSNLPRSLYNDSPKDASGDDDKLQHFFGSAFLAFTFESNDASERFGMFVERGERAFIEGGSYDDRDLRADRQGQTFGAALLKYNHTLPSEFFKIQSSPSHSENIPVDTYMGDR